MAPDISRRALLAGGLTSLFVVASGCRSGSDSAASGGLRAGSPDSSSEALPADLADAAHAELGLIASYRDALERVNGSLRDQLATLKRDHEQHLSRLSGQAAGRTRIAAFKADLDVLPTLERRSADRLDRAAVAEADGPAAALLASVAASHRAHVVELERIIAARPSHGTRR